MLPSQQIRLRQRAQFNEEKLYPATVTLPSGQTIEASRQARPGEMSLELGGPVPDAQQIFRIRKDLLPTKPAPDKFKLTWNGQQWRVESVDGDSPASPAWLLTCNLATR